MSIGIFGILVSLCLCVILYFHMIAAKNLILAGVKSVTLHDEGEVQLWDLSSNFIFSESDVGKNRALASVQKLQELNNAVAVSTLTTKLTKEKLSDFQVRCLLWFLAFFMRSLVVHGKLFVITDALACYVDFYLKYVI